MRKRLPLILPPLLLISGCVHPSRPLSVKDPDPSVKIPAIKAAVRREDRSVAPQLVRDLDSDDPAVRFFAIQGLIRLTGRDLGYRFFDDKLQRQPAVARWRQWLEGMKN